VEQIAPRAKVERTKAGNRPIYSAPLLRRLCSFFLFDLDRVMSRAGALKLSDVENPFLWIACEPCGRRGRYRVARLRATYGDDEALPALLGKVTGCPKQGGAGFSGRCKARYVSEAKA